MPKYTVTLTPEEEKALLTDMASIQDWLDNAIHNKARQCIDKVIAQHTDKQPQKLTPQAKVKIIRKLTLQTAVERQAAMDREE